MSSNVKDKLNDLSKFVRLYQSELIRPALRWAEINERLGDLLAVNGRILDAEKAFMRSFAHRLTKPQILIKALMALAGPGTYRRLRKI
jgi:hypothetical protein